MILSIRKIHPQINIFYNNTITETNMYENIPFYGNFLMCIEKEKKKSSSNTKYKQRDSLIFFLAYDMIIEVNYKISFKKIKFITALCKKRQR